MLETHFLVGTSKGISDKRVIFPEVEHAYVNLVFALGL